jgi:hypothetical protein
VIACVVPLFTTQCATRRIDANEKAQITGWTIQAPQLGENSLQKPSVMSNKTAGTIGLVSGLAGGLIGGAISTAVVAGADSNYRKSHAAEHDVLSAPTGYTARQLQQALAAEFRKSPFFGPKLSQRGNHRMEVKILNYGVQNLAGKERHSPAIAVKVSLLDAASTPIYTTAFSTNGEATSPEAVAPLASYLQQPQLLERHFQATVAQLAADIREALDECVAE